MNFTFYAFGNPFGFFGQYPNDNTAGSNERYSLNLYCRRLVISRKQNLVTYRFYQKLSDKLYIGFCITCNGMQLSRAKCLMALCSQVVDLIITSGRLLRCDERGNIYYAKSIKASISDFREIRGFIAYMFDSAADLYGCEKLKGHPENTLEASVDFSQSETDIEAMTYTSTTVVVDDRSEESIGYMQAMVAASGNKLRQADESIRELKNDNIKLQRQKKQFKVVLCLMLVLLVAAGMLWRLTGDLTNTRNDLQSTTSDLNNAKVTIEDKIATIQSLRTENYNLSENLSDFISFYYGIKSAAQKLLQYSRFSNWYSSNHGHNTTSSKTYEFYAAAGDRLTMCYWVDSEGCDYLKYYLSGPSTSRNNTFAGQSKSGDIDIPIDYSGNYSLTLSYTKDGSISSHSDWGYFYDIRLEHAGVRDVQNRIQNQMPNTQLAESTLSAVKSAPEEAIVWDVDSCVAE